MNLLISGTRKTAKIDAVLNQLNFLWLELPDTLTLITGVCPHPNGPDCFDELGNRIKFSIDMLGLEFGLERGWHIKQCPADWQRYGRRAGFVRNADMAALLEPGDRVIAFPEGESKGTRMMIKLAQKKGFEPTVYEL